MLKMIAQRWWVLGAVALTFAAAAACMWVMWPSEPWIAIVAGASIVVGGLGVVSFVRMIGAVRQLFRNTTDLKEELARLSELHAARGVEREALSARLALAERRLAALAIKLDATDKLDDPTR